MSGQTVASVVIIAGFLLTFGKYFFRNDRAFEGVVWPWRLQRYYRMPGVALHWTGWALVIAGLAWKFTQAGS